MSMATITARSILEQARIRHPLFHDAAMPDGALVLFLNQRQRSLLLQYGEEIGPMVVTTTAIASTISGLLVGSDAGVPVYLTTYEDGWPVFSSGGVPYFDFTGPKIASDPFGENGGTPGFPLPDNFVKLVTLTVTYDNDLTSPVDVVQERNRHDHIQGRNPTAFISGNRIIPILPYATAATSKAEWEDVATVNLTYIECKSIATLGDTITIPDALAECLVADVAHLLAMRTSKLSGIERQMFQGEVSRTQQMLSQGGDMLGDASSSSVIFTG